MRPPPGTYFHLQWRRALPWLGVGVVVVAFVGTMGLVAMARSSPAWWRSIDRRDPKMAQLAKDAENAIITKMSQNRPPEVDGPGLRRSKPWSFDLTSAQANAWLNTRLPKWVNNRATSDAAEPEAGEVDFRWPEEISELQVDFSEAGIRIGARIHAGGGDHVLSATLEPDVQSNGSLWLPARSVSVGRISLPAEWIADRAEEAAAEYLPVKVRALPETQGMFRAFAGDGPIVSNALVRLDAGRQVRILKIVPLGGPGGSLRVVCQTEERTDAARRADLQTPDPGLP
jgi:hypothetical protein